MVSLALPLAAVTGCRNQKPGASDRSVAPEIALAAGPVYQFEPGTQSAPRYWSAAAGDLNGDGNMDIVVCNLRENVYALLGRGDGTFASPIQINGGAQVETCRLADLDGDGWLDLVTSAFFEKCIFVCRGRGDGTFDEPVRISLKTQPYDVIPVDLNGDGRVDLAANCFAKGETMGSVLILINLLDGRFGEPTGFTVGGYPIQMAAGDFTGDGRPDLAVSCQESASPEPTGRPDSVWLLVNIGQGDFNIGTKLECADPSSLVAADLNRDGFLDLLVDSAAVMLFMGNATGTFQEAVPIETTMRGLAVADLNGDGWPDVVVGNVCFRNCGDSPGAIGGDSLLMPGPELAMDPRCGEYPVGLVLENLNGDGRIDIVMVGTTGMQVFCNESQFDPH